MADLQEILDSGDLTGMSVNGTINFTQSRPEDAGMVAVLDENGDLSGMKLPVQDTVWEDTNNGADVPINGVWAEHLSITIDQNISTVDTTIQVLLQVNNSSKFSQKLQIVATVDGVDQGDARELELPAGNSNPLFSFGLQQDIASGKTIIIAVASSSNDFTILCSQLASKFKIIKKAVVITTANDEPAQFLMLPSITHIGVRDLLTMEDYPDGIYHSPIYIEDRDEVFLFVVMKNGTNARVFKERLTEIL